LRGKKERIYRHTTRRVNRCEKGNREADVNSRSKRPQLFRMGIHFNHKGGRRRKRGKDILVVQHFRIARGFALQAQTFIHTGCLSAQRSRNIHRKRGHSKAERMLQERRKLRGINSRRGKIARLWDPSSWVINSLSSV